MDSAFKRVRPIARRWAHRLDNPEVRAARLLIRRLRDDPPDVLYLGDSTVLWKAPYDADRRNLGLMVSDALRDNASVHIIAGASYTARLYLAYLRLLEAHEPRPVVVHPLWIRGYFRPWIEHPVYGYEAALAKIGSLDPRGPSWRAWASFASPTPDDFKRHGELPYKTLLGDGCVKDYADALRRRTGLSERDRVRLIYAYHDSHRLISGTPELEPLARFGARLDELGVAAVVYHNPLSVQTGVEALGPDFETLTRSNRAVLEDAYLTNRSDRPQILQTGDIFAPDEFVDPNVADSHLNERGRARLAALISIAVQGALSPGPSELGAA